MEKNYLSYSVDIVGNCNLRCPSCPVGNIDLKHTRPKGFILKELFYEIADKIARESGDLNTWVSLYDWGEPTLHQDLPLFIEYLNKKKLRSRVSSNLNFDADFRSIVKSNPTEFKISISGYYEETYSTTHKRGKIEKVLSNIYKLKKFRDEFNTDTKFIMNFHVYKHNVGRDYSKMENLCKEIGFEFRPYAAMFMPIEKVLSLIDLKKKKISDDISFKLPKITDEDLNLISLLLTDPVKEYEKWDNSDQNKIKENQVCTRKENKIAIRKDGSVPICCGVYGGEFKVIDNFLDKSHEEIQSLRGNYSLCKVCMENGAHLNWKSDQKSIFNKSISGKSMLSKILRFYVSNKYKNILENYHKN
tara:strand:- start:971 stop:2050 length:1080 start_codon:yes stop_codon:yes gene_type:complete